MTLLLAMLILARIWRLGGCLGRSQESESHRSQYPLQGTGLKHPQIETQESLTKNRYDMTLDVKWASRVQNPRYHVSKLLSASEPSGGTPSPGPSCAGGGFFAFGSYCTSLFQFAYEEKFDANRMRSGFKILCQLLKAHASRPTTAILAPRLWEA